MIPQLWWQVELLPRSPCEPQSLKYLLSDPLEKMFVDHWSSPIFLFYMWGHKGPENGSNLPRAEPGSVTQRFGSVSMTPFHHCCHLAQPLSLNPSFSWPNVWSWESYINSFGLQFFIWDLKIMFSISWAKAHIRWLWELKGHNAYTTLGLALSKHSTKASAFIISLSSVIL